MGTSLMLTITFTECQDLALHDEDGTLVPLPQNTATRATITSDITGTPSHAAIILGTGKAARAQLLAKLDTD